MAKLTIEHDGLGTIVLRQSLSNIVLSVDQIQSVIRNLELAALEIRQAEFERQRRACHANAGTDVDEPTVIH